MKNNKKKKKKYSLAEKEKLAKLYTKYKEEYENQEKVEKYSGKKKRKFVNSRTNTTGFISKVVREMNTPLRNKPAEDNEFKKDIQVVRRCYQSYINIRQLSKIKIFLTLFLCIGAMFINLSFLLLFISYILFI